MWEKIHSVRNSFVCGVVFLHGAASNHYCCHTVYANHTAHERVADTVEFSPHYGKMPYRSSAENATIAVRKLTHALQNPSPASPFSNVGDKQMEALHQLSKLFQQSVNKNNDTPNSVAPPRMSTTRQSPQARVPVITAVYQVAFILLG